MRARRPGVVVLASSSWRRRPGVVVLASSSEASVVELILDDRGTSQSAATRLSATFNCEARRVGWDEPPRNDHGVEVRRPIRHAGRVEAVHDDVV